MSLNYSHSHTPHQVCRLFSVLTGNKYPTSFLLAWTITVDFPLGLPAFRLSPFNPSHTAARTISLKLSYNHVTSLTKTFYSLHQARLLTDTFSPASSPLPPILSSSETTPFSAPAAPSPSSFSSCLYTGASPSSSFLSV